MIKKSRWVVWLFLVSLMSTPLLVGCEVKEYDRGHDRHDDHWHDHDHDHDHDRDHDWR